MRSGISVSTLSTFSPEMSMSIQTRWPTPLLLSAFLLLPAARADADKEVELLRKEIQALRDEGARRERDLLELKKSLEVSLKRTQQEFEEVRKQMLEQQQVALDKLNEERKARVQAEIETSTWKARAVQLEKQIRRLEDELQRMRTRVQLPDAVPPILRDNFPTERIEGRIVQVDRESGLIKLSVGEDAGLKKGHHLHIFRLDPKPEKSKYLGTLEILNVRASEAVARLNKKLAGDLVIQVGDRVVSQLVPQEKK
jgi:hypothetical protein